MYELIPITSDKLHGISLTTERDINTAHGVLFNQMTSGKLITLGFRKTWSRDFLGWRKGSSVGSQSNIVFFSVLY